MEEGDQLALPNTGHTSLITPDASWVGLSWSSARSLIAHFVHLAEKLPSLSGLLIGSLSLYLVLHGLRSIRHTHARTHRPVESHWGCESSCYSVGRSDHHHHDEL